MLNRLAVLYLLAWIPFVWQPLRGQAPRVGVESSHKQEQQRETGTAQSQNAQEGTQKVPLFIYIHDAPIGKDDTAKEQHENARKRFTEVFNLTLAFAVAVFTGLLVAVGYFGVRAANRTLNVMKKTLVLTQRPRISVSAFYFSETRGVGAISRVPNGLEIGSFCSGQFYIRNCGGTDAYIQEIWCEVYIANYLPTKRPYEGEVGSQEKKVLAPGQSRPYLFALKEPLDDTTYLNIMAKHQSFHVLGWIGYTDALGIYRITCFCRHYDVVKERFVPVTDPDYECADEG
ncbi:MAG: hypothetical protein ABSG25_03135 [Bryobacteraceae bacterium]